MENALGPTPKELIMSQYWKRVASTGLPLCRAEHPEFSAFCLSTRDSQSEPIEGRSCRWDFWSLKIHPNQISCSQDAKDCSFSAQLLLARLGMHGISTLLFATQPSLQLSTCFSMTSLDCRGWPSFQSANSFILSVCI